MSERDSKPARPIVVEVSPLLVAQLLLEEREMRDRTMRRVLRGPDRTAGV